MRSGDGNTKYFHTSTVIKRRRNKIDTLMDKEGRWVENRDELKNMAVEFYSKMFKYVVEGSVKFIKGYFSDMEQEQKIF